MLRKVLHTQIHSEGAWTLVLAAACASLCALSVFIFSPGYMSTDTLFQLRQALGLVPLNDWHPPAMSLAWRLLINVTGSVASMAILQVAALWGSLFLIAWVIWKRSASRAWSICVVAVGTLPFVLNFAGVVWKDVHMCFALLGVVATVLWARERSPGSTVIRWLLFAVCVSLLVYATLVRRNAILAIPPLFLVVVTSLWGPRPSRRQWLCASGLFLASLIVTSVAITTIARPVDTKQLSSIALDDVLHVLTVSELRGLNISEPVREHLVQAAKECKRKKVVMNSYWTCFGQGKDGDFTAIAGADEVLGAWTTQMISHPSEYLQYRLEVFTKFLFESRQFSPVGVDRNELGQSASHPRMVATLQVYVNGAARSTPWFFAGWFWLVANLALLFWPGRGPFWSVIRAMSASSVLYFLTYFPFAPETDFRYVYWPVVAGCLGFVLAAGSALTARQLRQREGS